jgi:hypothetical protein
MRATQTFGITKRLWVVPFHRLLGRSPDTYYIAALSFLAAELDGSYTPKLLPVSGFGNRTHVLLSKNHREYSTKSFPLQGLKPKNKPV